MKIVINNTINHKQHIRTIKHEETWDTKIERGATQSKHTKQKIRKHTKTIKNENKKHTQTYKSNKTHKLNKNTQKQQNTKTPEIKK